MSFDLSEYVDVAERIRVFKERYPDGSLQSELTLTNGSSPGWLCKAYAYRDGSDERPGIGHAFEPIPGKTPYTRDSEAMNAETSAWGRAIVALGFETKKIASQQEVQARAEGGGSDASSEGQWVASTPTEPIKPSDVVLHWSRNKGKKLGELTLNQLLWYANEWTLQDTPSEYDHLVKSAAVALAAGDDSPITLDAAADVPF